MRNFTRARMHQLLGYVAASFTITLSLAMSPISHADRQDQGTQTQEQQAKGSEDLESRQASSPVRGRPVAWLDFPTSSSSPERSRVLINAQGVVLAPHPLLAKYFQLPVVETHDPLYTYEEGEKLEYGLLGSALEILAVGNEKFSKHKIEISTVRLASSYSLVANFSDGMTATFGLSEIPRQLADLHAIYEHALRKGKSLESVNLLPKRNIPITFATDPRG